MSEQRNCDERHKWKFGNYGASDNKSKKQKILKFSHFALYYVILGNLKLGFFKLEFWKLHTSRN